MLFRSIRSGSFDGDDLLGQRPCIGERHPRAESRQLLLDAVLSAGDRLIVTCNGADLTTNKPVFLDVPLIELLGEIGEIVDLDADHVPVVVRHRRHGFHEDALQPDRLVPVGGRPFTFDPAMLEAAEAKREAESARQLDLHEDEAPSDDGTRVAPPSKWSLPSRPLVVDGPVPIERLVDALVNPAKVLLRERLDVRLPGEVEAPDDNFTVEIDPLQKSSLGRDLLEALRRRADYGQWLDAAQLDGTLPPGALGASSLQDVVEEVGHLEAGALAWGIEDRKSTRLNSSH